jgi:hypothetical protein
MDTYNYDQKSIFNIKLRMTPTLIKKNGARSIWNTEKKAKLYFLTIVIEDKSGMLNGFIILDSFANVGNNDYINVHRTLYNWAGTSHTNMPDRLFFISTVIRCERRIKDSENIFENLKNDVRYQELAQTLSSIVSDTASFPSIVNIALKILEVTKKYMGRIDHNSLATITHYFSRNLGDLDKIGKFILSKSTSNIDFHFELIVHNKELSSGIDETSSQNFNTLSNNSNFQSMVIN